MTNDISQLKEIVKQQRIDYTSELKKLKVTQRKKLNNMELKMQKQAQTQNKQLQMHKNYTKQQFETYTNLTLQPNTNIVHENIIMEGVKQNVERAEIIQMTSTLQPTISKNTPKTKEKNRKQTPASVKRKITNNDPPTPPTQKNTYYPPPADYNSPPNSRKNIDAVVLGDSIIKHVKGRSVKTSSGKYLKVCSYSGACTEK